MSCPTLPTTLQARDGVALHVSHWPVSGARGVVQYVHSLCDHTGRFAETAQALNAAGWAVAAIDQRGHGLSGGARGALAHDDDLLHDQASLYDVVSQAYAPWASATPLVRVVLGSSMGGLVAARLVAALGDPAESVAWARPFDAAVLVAPALQPNMSFTQRALLSAFGRLAPDLAVAAGFRFEWSCSDEQEVARAYADPLVHDRITPRITYFMLNAGEQVRQRAAHWRTPTLLLYSHADRLVAAQGCERFAAAVPEGLLTLRGWATLRHALLHEPERREVIEAIAGWLDACGAQAVVARSKGLAKGLAA